MNVVEKSEGQGMRLALDPPGGIGALRFGMGVSEAVALAAEWGEVRVGQPAPGSAAFKVVVVHPDFEVVLLADDGETLTGVEVWRFERDDADVRVEFRGMDVFRVPARELVRRISEEGHEVDDGDEEAVLFPGLTLLLSRDTSREVPVDPHDGLPLYFHYALVGPSGYLD